MAKTTIFGREIYYEIHGDLDAGGLQAEGEALPLLLVMGMAGSCAGWLPLQVPEFAKTRTVVIFDHRGVAESDDPGGPFTTEDLARDALALLDAVQIAKADVLGPFMGGMVAQQMALIAPERIGHIILVGTYAKADAKRKLLLSHWAELAKSNRPAESMLHSRLLWTLQDETLEQTDLIEAMTNFFEREGEPVSADLLARQCQACIEHDTSEEISKIQSPTLILCGKQDQLTPAKFHRELADSLPDGRLVTLGYGGHMIMVESAERFNQIVLQFLSDER